LTGRIILGVLGRHLRRNPPDFSLDSEAFLAALPNSVPIFTLGAGSVVDDLEHPFSWVLVITTSSSTLLLKVVKQSTRVLTNVSKVHGLTTTSKEEKSVKLLEQNGTGLMDGAEDSLSCVGKLAKEGDNSPRALRVQTAGRFIKEKQQLGLGSEFDTDSQKLALLNVETFSGDTDDSAGKVAHVEHVNDLLNPFMLLLIAHG
jgi:hypothetical protein